MISQLNLSLSKNETTGTVLGVAVPSCQALAVNAPSGVTVNLYRMPQVTTGTASFSGGITGPHYDPLIPVAQTGGTVCAADKFVWADISVSTSVAPGLYNFTIGDLPVSLTVWNLTIPAKAAMPVYIQVEAYKLLSAHGLSSSSNVSVEAPLVQAYADAMRAHRIEPIEHRIVDPAASGTSMNLDNFSAYGGSFRQLVMNGATAPVCAIAPSSIGSSWSSAASLQAWENSIKAEAGLKDAWAYITDEPSDLAGTVTRAKLVKANAPSMKVMVTHEPTEALIGVIDHFTPVFEYFKVAGHFSDYSRTPGYWLYGSCMSHGSCGNGTPRNLTGTPDLMLDEPDVFGRAFPLVAYSLGAGAALYYDATYSLGSAWTNQYYFGGNGDGNLLYPGVSGQRGFTSNQPVSSIRMKAIRQGQYDIEYVKMAKAAGLSTNLSTLVPNQFNWSRKNSDYQAMHDSIGNSLSR